MTERENPPLGLVVLACGRDECDYRTSPHEHASAARSQLAQHEKAKHAEYWIIRSESL